MTWEGYGTIQLAMAGKREKFQWASIAIGALNFYLHDNRCFTRLQKAEFFAQLPEDPSPLPVPIIESANAI